MGQIPFRTLSPIRALISFLRERGERREAKGHMRQAEGNSRGRDREREVERDRDRYRQRDSERNSER